jgi:hypothetical protein
MNASPAGSYNTIFQSFALFDIRDEGAPDKSARDYVSAILGATLSGECQQDPNPTDTGGEPPQIDAPAKTVLYRNRPNPFNPTTTISFDLAQSGHVSLKIYDVAGRLVRTGLDKHMVAGRGHQWVWDGMDSNGQRTSSGVYFYRLEAKNFSAVNKMVMMK